MNLDAFKVPCPECGKDVYVYSNERSKFCSRQCESNWRYRRKFQSRPEEERPSWEEVRKFGTNK